MTWSYVDDLVVGGGARLTAESEQGLDPGIGVSAAVEPEREHVEVDLQVLGADPRCVPCSQILRWLITR